MRKRFDPVFLIRFLSFFILSLLPNRYLPEFFPWYVLPVLSFVAVFLALPLAETRIRSIPLALAVTACALVPFGLLRFLSGFLPFAGLHRFFLHAALSRPIFSIYFATAFVFTVFHRRHRGFRTAEPLILTTVYCLFFWSQSGHSLTIVPHPVILAGATFIFMFAQFFQLVYLYRRSYRPAVFLAGLLPLILGGFYLLFISYNALSVSNNGGLLQPTLFRFDFSPYLSLQNEIKMNDKLVLIVHTAPEDTQNFLKRTWLSGWNPKKGFYEQAAPDEAPLRLTLPQSPTELDHRPFEGRHRADQEYFIVNFDPQSLIAMDYPVSVTPWRMWDSSSFNGAYSVVSEVSGFMPFELFDSPAPTGDPDEGLSARDLAFYTEIDEETRSLVSPFALEQTGGIAGYFPRINSLVEYLHDGDFRYSLKPGVAADGNQLRLFLQDTKKGYCTYFAFSLCLMLRSLGIPSRVAAGFFTQPGSGALDYFPVRANMAHAWVEVFFPHYGWISFDPTTTQVAEGENFEFGGMAGGDEFLRLLDEIFDRRGLLEPGTEAPPDQRDSSILTRLYQALRSGLRRFGPEILAFLLAFLPTAALLSRRLRMRFSRNPRRRILLMAASMNAAIGYRGRKRKTYPDKRNYPGLWDNPDALAFYALEQKARFAPVCTPEDANEAWRLLKVIKKSRRRNPAGHFLLILCLILASRTTLTAQESPADELLARAEAAVSAENWESAITLLTEGNRRFSSDPRFPYTLGSLFLDQDLYLPAKKQLTRAWTLGLRDPELYSLLADCTGYLNEDEEALSWQHLYLEQRPDDLNGWSNFGWLCYKTNRLDEGINALLSATDRYGPDGTLYAGLGTLYTAAFDYPNAKLYYTRAIDIAREKNQSYLLSIYYYNRSILEEIFYNFKAATDDTRLSLEASPRSSGYLMQGELDLRRLDFPSALTRYSKAFSLDSTPLATLGLAETLLQSGFPDEADAYLTSVEKKELSWIANYGTTTDQFLADFNKIKRDICKLRGNREKYKIVHSFSTFVFKQLRRISLTFDYWYRDGLYRIYNKRVASKYEQSERHYSASNGLGLYKNSFYFLSLDRWPGISRRYLEGARAIEETHIPAARPSYLYETGRISGNSALLEEAIVSFDPEWERNYLVLALVEYLDRVKGPYTDKEYNLTRQLYDLQPASFQFHDLEMPVQIKSGTQEAGSGSKKYSREVRRIGRTLLSAGFVQTPDSTLEIVVDSSETELSLVLADRNRNFTLCSQVIHKSGKTALDISMLVNAFTSKVFSSRSVNP